MSELYIFGDSILKGAICDDSMRLHLRKNHSYPYLSDTGFQVNNKSKIGSTILNGEAAVNNCFNRIERTTTVLVGFGGNDCSFDWKNMFFDPDTEKTPNVAPDQFVSVYTDTIKKIQGTGATIFICNLPPIDAERHFEWIATQGPSGAILEWLGDIGMLYRWHEMYNRFVEQIAGKTGCKLLDIRSLFLSNHNFKKLIGKDGMHPTEEGYNIIDKVIAANLVTENPSWAIGKI